MPASSVSCRYVVARAALPAPACCVLAFAAATAQLLACSDCTSLGQIRFDRASYYAWAWERSGGTLEIKGVVPDSAEKAGGLAGSEPVAPCPPNAEAIAYLRAVVDPTRNETAFENIRPDGGSGRRASANECVYDYDDKHCAGTN